MEEKVGHYALKLLRFNLAKKKNLRFDLIIVKFWYWI